MKKMFFTVAGMNHRFGNEFIEPGMEVRLVKEPDNEADKEAIKVELEGLGLIGYVANSTYTVLGESMSAGRLYDKLGDEAVGVVKYKLPGAALGEVTLTGLEEAELARELDEEELAKELDEIEE